MRECATRCDAECFALVQLQLLNRVCAAHPTLQTLLQEEASSLAHALEVARREAAAARAAEDAARSAEASSLAAAEAAARVRDQAAADTARLQADMADLQV